MKLLGVEETMNKLKRLDDRLKKRILKKVGRKSLKPMVDSYKKNIKDADEVFKVYRNGKIYAEILPGTLRKSVGVKMPKKLQSKNAVGLSVGPRRTGKVYGKPARGGWYAGMVNFGWLQPGGKEYNGKNRNFAQKAMNSGKGRVAVGFRREFASIVNKEIRKLKFGQRMGLR